MQKGIDYIGVGVGALIFNDQGQILIAKRTNKVRNEPNKWEFPGGSVRFGEKCEDAVVREVKEEFDIKIKVITFLGLVDHIIPEQEQHWVSPSYIAKLISGTLKIMEPDRCCEIKWVKISEINTQTLSSVCQVDLKNYVNKFGYQPPK